MKVYFVRHGKTQANINHTYNGIIDEPLAQEGIIDLENKKDIYKNLDFDYIYCSPLQRCKQTFEILFENKKVDEFRDDLVEMNFGDWAGESYEKKFKELEAQGYTWNDYVNPKNGETCEELFDRTTKFLDEIKAKHNNGDKVLVLCHGIVISSIMKKHFLQDEVMYFLSPENGLGYVIDFDAKDNKIEKIKKG